MTNSNVYFKGGSWNSVRMYCSVIFQGVTSPYIARKNIGFRIIKVIL